MGDKHKVLGSKAKLWGSGGEIGDFYIFLIKIPHFEAYLSLNFYKKNSSCHNRLIFARVYSSDK